MKIVATVDGQTVFEKSTVAGANGGLDSPLDTLASAESTSVSNDCISAVNFVPSWPSIDCDNRDSPRERRQLIDSNRQTKT